MKYVRCQRYEGKPYIGEYLDESTGQWLMGANERSRHYNHSTFADLLITGVIGLRPRSDDVIEIHPLLPEGTWRWFCVDRISYHGQDITILWDRDGDRYGRGKGLILLADGKELARSDGLVRITAELKN
jgi:hypothetical protein